MPVDRRQALADAASLVGESWSFAILQEFFFGARTFGDLIDVLDAPRATLSERLGALVGHGILAERPREGRRKGYRLTEQGRRIYDLALTLQQFGDRHLVRTPPVRLIHRDHDLDAEAICTACCTPIRGRDLVIPTVEREPVRFERRPRRSPERSVLTRGRTTSVGLTLELVGDRWSWLVVDDLAAAPRRFDELVDGLGISRNVLTERLNRMRANEILGVDEARRYHLLDRGGDLVPALVALEAVGARLSGELVEPSRHASCGSPVDLRHRCATCGELIVAADVTALV